ncbi:MAG: ABC transporter ATP-binding protein [Pseudomonadota bacterium]
MSKTASPIGILLEPVRINLIKAAIFQAFAALSGIVPLIAIAEIGRHLLSAKQPSPDVMFFWAGVAAAALGLKLLLSYLALSISHKADVDLQLDLRRRIVARILKVSLGWFDHQSSGSLKKILQDDISALHYLVAHSVPDLTAAIVTPITILAYLFLADWRMALIVLLPLVAGVLVYAIGFLVAGTQLKNYGNAIRKVNAAAIAYVQGIGPIKAFGKEDQAFISFKHASKDFLKYFWDMIRPAAPSMALSEILFAPLTSVMLVIIIGLVLLEDGRLELADIFPALFLAPGITAAIAPVAYAQNDMMLANKAAARICKILETPVLNDVHTPVVLPYRPSVSFDDVQFSYDDQNTAIKKVSFALEPGSVTALVGPSGSGKSTVARLLPRFWDVVNGTIRIANHDIKEIPLEQLYQTVSFVFQEPKILRLSLAENIALARPKASEAEIEAAAKAAFIHEKIVALPKGYDSVFGDDVSLSGGEAQRIAIARAILADRPILVLDEATAFVDPEAEAEIQLALSELASGRTLLVIAHRLSTIIGADQILVMQEGDIVERGRHKSLLQKQGLYYEMWQAAESEKALL